MGAGEEVRAVLGDAWWDGTVRQSEELPRAAEVRGPGAVGRLGALLQAWAVRFAAVRPDVLSSRLAASRRGLGADEAAGFLAALDARVFHVDSAGFVVAQVFRPKASGGRYALFSRNGSGVAVSEAAVRGSMSEVDCTGHLRVTEAELVESWGLTGRGPLGLDGPILLILDNPSVHKAAELREFAASRDWLTIYYLPPYAPDLNPVEGIWSLLRRGWLFNVAFSTPEQLVQRIRRDLRHIPYRSDLMDGCLAETGLTIRPT